jgi:NADPH-dependent 2,4-dienoyl-CoA reductase/sulfur reductase-like enzyme/rhodanese-related sulfurtransferase
MDTKRIVVIGGSAAGPKAAAKARRIDEKAQIVLFQQEPDLSMASCGYPYYVGGVFNDRNMLLSTPTGITRDPKFYLNAKAIDARASTQVTAIDVTARTVFFKNLLTDAAGSMEYDSLVIATGALARMPDVPGAALKGITTLQSMRDADFLRKVRDEGKIKKAVIVGGGLIGIEASEALILAGIEITVVEMLPQVLTFLDPDLAKIVENYLRSKLVNVITNNGIAGFIGEDGVLSGVKLQNGTELACELAVVAIGVVPNVRLAQEAGIKIGVTGAIEVNEYMQTSDTHVYAAGDCTEKTHRITGKKVLAPYGDIANLQARVAGENAVLGNTVTFPGVIHTGICKIFDYTAGSTGLSETAACKNGYSDYVTVINASTDKPGFMGGALVITKLIADAKTGKVLGAQCVGPGNVNRQIAQWAMAIQAGMRVEDLVNADLPYAPPFSLTIDHFIATAHLMQNKMKGRLKGVSAIEVNAKIDKGELPFLLDVRGSDEYDQMRLGIGEVLIPLGALRKRLHEIPQDKTREIICYCKISLRGYEAALILEANGWKNVSVMEGGIVAWPYKREK